MIKKIIDEEHSKSLAEAIGEEKGDDDFTDNDIAAIAAHVVLSKTIPEILDREYLSEATKLNSRLVNKAYAAVKEISMESRVGQYHQMVEAIRKKWSRTEVSETESADSKINFDEGKKLLETPKAIVEVVEGDAVSLKSTSRKEIMPNIY